MAVHLTYSEQEKGLYRKQIVLLSDSGEGNLNLNCVGRHEVTKWFKANLKCNILRNTTLISLAAISLLNAQSSGS